MNRRTNAMLLALVAATLSACSSMMKHSNTMVFATTTKAAVDVSQDPTGTLSLTLGYKRLETVWMPLLANQQPTGKDGKESEPVPGTCPTPQAADSKQAAPSCPLFVGSDGQGIDTYSVLATFSGSAGGVAGGSSPSAEAKGSIAQFFATGLAARILAGGGGNAALFNTNAVQPSQQAKEDLATEIRESTLGANRLLGKLKNSAGDAIDAAKFDAWVAALAKEPGINQDFQNSLAEKKKAGLSPLTGYLERRWPAYGAQFDAAAKAAKL